jgi:membrane metallo-endopeptidase-like protein 1
LNGISTKDENIADNGGIRMSYLAYRKWLINEEYQDKLLPGLNMTHEQQFFLGFAQV